MRFLDGLFCWAGSFPSQGGEKFCSLSGNCERRRTMKLTREEIMEQMELFKDGQALKFTIPEIFGGGTAIITLNPGHPGPGQKKYLLKLGKDENQAGEANPYWATDKSKDLAKWVADRQGDQIG
jgi:hypothetical protein